jgi:hypothetical protein
MIWKGGILPRESGRAKTKSAMSLQSRCAPAAVSAHKTSAFSGDLLAAPARNRGRAVAAGPRVNLGEFCATPISNARLKRWAAAARRIVAVFALTGIATMLITAAHLKARGSAAEGTDRATFAGDDSRK